MRDKDVMEDTFYFPSKKGDYELAASDQPQATSGQFEPEEMHSFPNLAILQIVDGV